MYLHTLLCMLLLSTAQVDTSVCCCLEGAQRCCGVPTAGEELQLWCRGCGELVYTLFQSVVPVWVYVCANHTHIHTCMHTRTHTDTQTHDCWESKTYASTGMCVWFLWFVLTAPPFSMGRTFFMLPSLGATLNWCSPWLLSTSWSQQTQRWT